MLLTTEAIRRICKEQQLYFTPSLNDTLYLNFKGINKVADGCLDEYDNLKCLFLSNNELSNCQGLQKLDSLCCLYMENNSLTSISGLPKSLVILDISNNHLKTLSGISNCANLTTLVASNNLLGSQGAVKELRNCHRIESLDLQSNTMTDLEKILDILAQLPLLKCLCLNDNGFPLEADEYRSTVLARLPGLLFLDNMPVTEPA